MRPYGFKKSERLLKGDEFKKVRRQGKKTTCGRLIVHIKTNDLGYRRLGLSVGVKYGNAIERNRLKRYLRECFRVNKDTLPSSIDISISIKRGASQPNGFCEVTKDFMGAFSK